MEGINLRPEHKHGAAIAARQGEIDVTSLPLYTTIANAIKEASAVAETAPVILYGISSQEYCIVPCLYDDQEQTVVRVLQHLRGAGWFADIFRMSESLNNPDKYRHAILISWDPRVISASFSPRFYSVRDTSRLPCSVCSKQKTGTVDECVGCALFKLWLAGVAGMKTWNDPCSLCCVKKAPTMVSSCTECPVKKLWKRRKNGEFGDNKSTPVKAPAKAAPVTEVKVPVENSEPSTTEQKPSEDSTPST